ncbi:MAG: PilZ domain-containing protein [Acidobacteriota bacterium]|nr:PilZ domain-containing protein [Acidobacteriota bacterium]
MNLEVVDLRKGDRFTVIEPITGTFGVAEMAVLNLSLGGAQISHALPLRIGTRARLWCKRGDVTITVSGTVVWSHVTRMSTGMAYKTGVRLDNADAHYALALNTLIRSAVVQPDGDSLQRKIERMREREEQRRSQVRILPTVEPPPA